MIRYALVVVLCLFLALPRSQGYVKKGDMEMDVFRIFFGQNMTYVKYLSGVAYNKIDNLVAKNSKDHFTLKAWNVFSNWACKLDDEYCTTTALKYFKQWRKGTWISADIKDAAFCVGVKNRGPEIWNSILNVYKDPASPSERQSALWALACSKDPAQLSKYLDFMFNGFDGPIRPHDFVVMTRTLATTPEGITALLEFLTNKWDRIINQVINGELIATSIYSALASNVILDEEIKKMDDLRKNVSVPDYLRKIFNTTYLQVENNVAWFETHQPKIDEHLKRLLYELGLDVYVKTTTEKTTPTPTSTPTSTSNSTPTSTSTSALFSGQKSSRLLFSSLLYSSKLQFSSWILPVIFVTLLVGASYYSKT